jgi:hypothetical protein
MADRNCICLGHFPAHVAIELRLENCAEIFSAIFYYKGSGEGYYYGIVHIAEPREGEKNR